MFIFPVFIISSYLSEGGKFDAWSRTRLCIMKVFFYSIMDFVSQILLACIILTTDLSPVLLLELTTAHSPATYFVICSRFKKSLISYFSETPILLTQFRRDQISTAWVLQSILKAYFYLLDICFRNSFSEKQ